MTKSLFPGFDGLMTLSRREGVDVRPTLLRVLTDLYVQAPTHSDDEQRQFIVLATRLIDQVDDATRSSVKATRSGSGCAPTAARSFRLSPAAIISTSRSRVHGRTARSSRGV